MLVMLLTTLALSGVAVYGVAKTSRALMHRFGLDLMSALLWLGLAERPTGRPAR